MPKNVINFNTGRNKMPKRIPMSVTVLPECKDKLKRLAEKADTTQGRYIEKLLDRVKEPVDEV